MPQVLCLGELLIDRLADNGGENIESVTHWTDYPGGAPANVACALQRLGTSSAFLGCVGSDEMGDRLLATLSHHHVNLQGIYPHPTAPTRIVYVTRSEMGDRRFAGFSGNHTTPFADTQYPITAVPHALFESAQYLVLGSLILAVPPSQQTVLATLKRAKHDYKIQCWMDLNWRPMFWPSQTEAQRQIDAVLPLLDFLKVSDTEAIIFFKAPDPAKIHGQYPHLKGIFVTGGDRGTHYWMNGYSGFVPAFSVHALDTTGAGDGFVAGCLHQLCQQARLNLKDSSLNNPKAIAELVVYANAVGALTTLQLGAIADHPTAADVKHFLASKRDD